MVEGLLLGAAEVAVEVAVEVAGMVVPMQGLVERGSRGWSWIFPVKCSSIEGLSLAKRD